MCGWKIVCRLPKHVAAMAPQTTPYFHYGVPCLAQIYRISSCMKRSYTCEMHPSGD